MSPIILQNISQLFVQGYFRLSHPLVFIIFRTKKVLTIIMANYLPQINSKSSIFSTFLAAGAIPNINWGNGSVVFMVML